MQKRIKYTGINRAVPQSDAADGSCQEIINARYKKGAWRPVGRKVNYKINNIAVSLDQDYDTVVLHDIEGGIVDGEPNWIGYIKSTGKVYLINPSSVTSTEIARTETPGIDIDIVFLKRTMIITSELGVEVMLFSDGSYNKLSSLPVPQIDLTKINESEETTSLVVASDIATLATSLIGNYYELLTTQSEQEGRLFGSIMYICVYRLFDGSYYLPSVPRYIEISNGGVFSFINPPDPIGYSADITIALAGLSATIDNDLYNIAEIGDTKDIIESICVFATNITTLHDISDTIITEDFVKLYMPGDGQGIQKDFAEILQVNKDFQKLAESASWYKIHEFDFETAVNADGKTTEEVDLKNYYQTYSTNDTLTTDQFTHHTYCAKSAYVYNDRLHLLNVKTNLGKPYIHWSNRDDIGVYSSENASLVVYIKTTLGKAVVVGAISIPTYTPADINYSSEYDDWYQAYIYLQQLSGIVPDSGYVETLPPRPNLGIFTYKYRAVWKTYSGPTSEKIYLPEIIGYNDYRAYRVQLITGSGVVFDQKLTKNESMNFAFYHSPNFSKVDSDVNANFPVIEVDPADITFSASIPDEVELPFDTNRLQVSEIQNPIYFPTANSYQIGTGDGITMMAGSEPLSQGQFGQFPLQVFTTKGVWALEIGTGDILYTNVVPSSSEVIENRMNVISIGNGVVFSTKKGLFVLSGRESIELSEIVEGTPTFADKVTELQTLINDSRFVSGLSNAQSIVDFMTYISSAMYGYDNYNKELIISNHNYYYSYVYSLEGKYWYKISQSYDLFISSYPKLLGRTTSGIVSITDEDVDSQDIEVLIVSNAQSFELPNFFKKIDRVIQRCSYSCTDGKFPGFYVFASDDLQTWSIITGRQKSGTYIKDLLVQRSHGSAKYYCFIFAGAISLNSEINDVEIIVKEKWNNKLR